MVQHQSFYSAIDTLKSTKDSLPKSSSFHQLDSFMDDNGLLRVGGRVGKSKLNRGTVHPVLFPKENEITNAIVKWCHKAVAHGRRGLVSN